MKVVQLQNLKWRQNVFFYRSLNLNLYMKILLKTFVLLLVAGNMVAQEDLKDWFHKDPSEGYMGISTEKAYKALEGRSNQPVIVAIIDSGVDAEHEDLAKNMWINADEIAGNGIDDDNNGYIDDIHGWNFIGGPNGKNSSLMMVISVIHFFSKDPPKKYPYVVAGCLFPQQKTTVTLIFLLSDLTPSEGFQYWFAVAT